MNGGKTGIIFEYLYLFVTRNIAYFVCQIQQYEEIYFNSSFQPHNGFIRFDLLRQG